jgi:radical SAM superfamily enzyme YgiQ (UPF0313 family)
MIKSKILIMSPEKISPIKKTIISGYIFTNIFRIVSLLKYYKYDISVCDFASIYNNDDPDNNFNNHIKSIINNKYKYIFIYAEIDYLKSSMIYAKEIKKYLPNVIIIINHKIDHIDIKQELLSNINIDISAIGEEDVVLDIVSGKDLKDIKGISYRDENGNIIHNESRPLIDNLDDLPSAVYGYELFNTSFYNNNFKVYSSRGCDSECIYCRLKTKKNCNIVRYRNPELVVLEIKNLIEKFNKNAEIKFNDNIFNTNKEYTYSLMDAFDKYNLNIKWHCYSRVSTIDEELLQSMYDHGCYNITYNVVSSNQNILNFINKDIYIDQIENISKITKKIGIKLILYFTLGYPNEDLNSIMSTFKFCKKINPDNIQYNIATPIPGTKLYDYCVENDLLLTKDWDLYDTLHQIIKIDSISNNKIEKLIKFGYKYSLDFGNLIK